MASEASVALARLLHRDCTQLLDLYDKASALEKALFLPSYSFSHARKDGTAEDNLPPVITGDEKEGICPSVLLSFCPVILFPLFEKKQREKYNTQKHEHKRTRLI
ncbi:uncharacterized [Tachysurus ichikawai]